MGDMTHPYRTPTEMTILQETNKPLYGLIRAPAPTKPHSCSPPSSLYLLWMFLTGRRIHRRSLWRCHQCSKVFILEEIYDNNGLTWNCIYDKPERKWQEAGGNLEDKFLLAERND